MHVDGNDFSERNAMEEKNETALILRKKTETAIVENIYWHGSLNMIILYKYTKQQKLKIIKWGYIKKGTQGAIPTESFCTRCRKCMLAT